MLDIDPATSRNPAHFGTPAIEPPAPKPAVFDPIEPNETCSATQNQLNDTELKKAISPLPQTTRDAIYWSHKDSRLTPLQTWEGFVTAIAESSFTARLHDLEPNGSEEAEEAVFHFDDVDEDDRSLVREGGVFRWIIGYRDHEYGKRERVSSLIFRRLPGWSRSDLESARKEGEALARSIRWE